MTFYFLSRLLVPKELVSAYFIRIPAVLTFTSPADNKTKTNKEKQLNEEIRHR